MEFDCPEVDKGAKEERKVISDRLFLSCKVALQTSNGFSDVRSCPQWVTKLHRLKGSYLTVQARFPFPPWTSWISIGQSEREDPSKVFLPACRVVYQNTFESSCERAFPSPPVSRKADSPYPSSGSALHLLLSKGSQLRLDCILTQKPTATSPRASKVESVASPS
eukprot:173192-Hanusia_phi.AAC.1